MIITTRSSAKAAVVLSEDEEEQKCANELRFPRNRKTRHIAGRGAAKKKREKSPETTAIR